MKSINESINEARQAKYRVSFVAPSGNPIDADVLIDVKFAKDFYEFIQDELGNTIEHASDEHGDPIEP